MNDVQQGSGWGQASDDTWYAPAVQLGPEVPEKRRRQPVRPMAILIGVVVALVVLGVAAPILGSVWRHAPRVAAADRIVIPSSPPSSLGGQQLNPEGILANSDWMRLASNVASESSTSFGSVYGVYPPQVVPTASTFLVIGAEPTGGTAGSSGLAAQMRNAMQAAAATVPGSHSLTTPTRPSVLGGVIVCGSFAAPQISVGACVWQSSVVSVMVFTYSADLATVNQLTDRVVSELQGQAADD
jgi:hypothetical protein